MKAPRIILIAARASNGVIGDQNGLPWHFPEDLAYFKRKTLGHAVIMGRATFDGLGRALPGRSVIVVSRSGKALDLPAGVAQANSLPAAIRYATRDLRHDIVFIAGGAQIYAQAFDLVDEMRITEIGAPYPGDTVFPEPDWSNWKHVASEDLHASQGPQLVVRHLVKVSEVSR